MASALNLHIRLQPAGKLLHQRSCETENVVHLSNTACVSILTSDKFSKQNLGWDTTQAHITNYTYGRPCGVSLSLSILSPAADSTHTAVFVTWCCKDISPGVHLQSPGLLQLSFVRRHQQLTSMTAVCTECCRQVNHADWSPWTHLTCSTQIALAASSTPCRLQTGNTDV